MGQFIKLPGVNPGADRPRVDLVDSMAPNSGGLLLLDATHPVKPAFAAGSVPLDGTTMPNLFASQARALTGGTELDVTPALSVGGMSSVPSASTGVLERTAKGGLHVIMPNQTAVAANVGAVIPWPVAILNYLAANPTHQLFISLWGYLTRPGNSTQGWSAADFEASGTGSTSAFLHSFGNDGTIYPATSQRIASRRSPSGSWRPAQVPAIAASPFLMNIGLNGYTGTVGTGRRGRAFGIASSMQPFAGGTGLNNVSGVFYRAFLEDLTVSGRTYNAVDALDLAQYTKEVLTAGGRYYGDTYTAPSAVAA